MIKQMGLCMLVTVNLVAAEVSGAIENKSVEVIELQNSRVELRVTPNIGGRVLSFSAKDNDNFLRLGEEVHKYPTPIISAEAENIGYLGHEMWNGPQSAWWTQQSINAERLAAKAIWPPDPYTSFADNKIVKKTADQLVLEAPPSPISGLQMSKTFTLPKENPNSVRLDVQARNIRKENVSWDLWFNTRVHQDTQVYVPVAGEDEVRVEHFTDEIRGPLVSRLNDGIFTLVAGALSEGKRAQRGKAFLQPAHGWMAAFNRKQAFIIQFQLQPRSAIHPEQGQVELYLDYLPDAPEVGLLELEVHAPYRKLAPGEEMSASEVWTILRYEGPDTRAAHLAFLRKHARELQLQGL